VTAASPVSLYRQPQAAEGINLDDYAPLVKKIAYHLLARMPASVQLDDLIQAGMLGLLEAAQKFDGTKGASFETYAGIRIKGAMVDEMRRGDWVPRSVHRNARRISQAMAALEARLGRDATDAEVADYLEIPLDDYQHLLADSLGGKLFSYNEDIDDEDSCSSSDEASSPLQDPSRAVQQQSMQAALAAAISQLPEREQLVLSLYYEQDMNLKEIGLVLGVSESRVSQIHSQAALRLKGKLSGWRQ
jgi:RNA polymerase sigma factor FliA